MTYGGITCTVSDGVAPIAFNPPRLHRHLVGRIDAGEGIAAFLDLRAPEWKMGASTDWSAWPNEQPGIA